MANSQRFRQLRSELGRLRKHFLPQRWDPTGSYSERKLDRTRAYRILAHAEIESFIEDILLSAVEDKYQQWVNAKKPSYVMTCLLVASKIGWQDVETQELDLSSIDPLKIKREDESINDIIKRAVEQYRDIIKENHGIKPQDLKRLLMPVGIVLSDLDQTWINNMSSFGGQRGFVAHTSRLGVKNVPDPETEKRTIDSLLIGLRVLDEIVVEIKTGP